VFALLTDANASLVVAINLVTDSIEQVLSS